MPTTGAADAKVGQRSVEHQELETIADRYPLRELGLGLPHRVLKPEDGMGAGRAPRPSGKRNLSAAADLEADRRVSEAAADHQLPAEPDTADPGRTPAPKLSRPPTSPLMRAETRTVFREQPDINAADSTR